MDKIDAFFQTINFPSFYLKVILSFITSLLPQDVSGGYDAYVNDSQFGGDLAFLVLSP